MLKDLREFNKDDYSVKLDKLNDYKLSFAEKEILNISLSSLGYGFNSYTSYASSKENIAVMPNQYFYIACELYDFSTSLYKYFIYFDKIRNYSKELVGTADEIIAVINADPNKKSIFENEDDIHLFSSFIDAEHKKDEYRLGAKRLINDKGEARGSSDCFGSVILKFINLPDASSAIFGRLIYDLCEHRPTYDFLLKKYNAHSVLTLDDETKVLTRKSHLSKSFLLLAGISGTGKTRFVREQAQASGSLGETYCLTSVRPDWHEPSDLLGYASRLSGQTEFVTTDVLQFIAKAWRAIADSALELKSHDDFGMTVEGERPDLQRVLPYWLCLDEMNLAPVEQYFADYLSVLETRQWIWTDDSFSYNCDALLKPSVFMELGDSAKQGLRRSLGFEDERYSDIWDLITTHGLGLPFNLIVAGTVNMDETTHGFSRKVIDRALSFDFGEFFPNNFGSFFAPDTQAKTLSYPLLSQVNSVDLQESCDPDGSKSVNFLDAVNDVLRSTPFELAYRALNELLLAVACQKPSDEVELQAVWDDFMMCKVLPRIEGDTDKLGSDPSLLNKLSDLLSKHLDSIWIDQSGTTLRPDLYREKVSGDDKLIKVPCRSRTKLEWMTKRLTQSGFTSFWP